MHKDSSVTVRRLKEAFASGRGVIITVERRDALVDLCTGVARECGFDQIRFESGEIAQASLSGADVGIALRACDTTTDDAIYGGIRSGAEIILTAPCCHTRIKLPQLHPPAHLAPLFKFGIQMDRMAESITDALRSMYLEASGYHTSAPGINFPGARRKIC